MTSSVSHSGDSAKPGNFVRAQRNASVLLVDDEEHIREAVKMVLERRGYRVTACEDAQDAVELLEQGHTPDVILLDLMMPRMDGWEFRVGQKQLH